MSVLTALPWVIIIGLGLGFWIKSIIKDNSRYNKDNSNRYSNNVKFRRFDI